MRKITRMHSHTAKQEAINAIERLPDDGAMDEIVYRLYVLNRVRQGLQPRPHDLAIARRVPKR